MYSSKVINNEVKAMKFYNFSILYSINICSTFCESFKTKGVLVLALHVNNWKNTQKVKQ